VRRRRARGLLPRAGQDYPARPIKIIVPLAPGGLADYARPHRLATAWPRHPARRSWSRTAPAAPERSAPKPRPRAPADGYTLLMGGLSTNAVLAHLTRLAFDPAKDLVPIIHVATFPNVLVGESRPAGQIGARAGGLCPGPIPAS
jgi:hypothetical protein